MILKQYYRSQAIARKVKKSETNMRAIKIACVKVNVDFKMPVLACVTRWGSSADNLEFVLYLRDPLQYCSVNVDQVGGDRSDMLKS